MQNRRNYIKEKIRIALNVRADEIMPGFGTTNTGNLARVCFRQYKEFAKVIEVDEELVKKFATVLAAFSTKDAIDLEKLKEYSSETYVYNYEIYCWSIMSPTVHKLLWHGCEIAIKFPLSLAYYSEDAIESWHKYHGYAKFKTLNDDLLY